MKPHSILGGTALGPGNPVTPGKIGLAAGRHGLRFQVVAPNLESQDCLVGIHHVIVK